MKPLTRRAALGYTSLVPTTAQLSLFNSTDTTPIELHANQAIVARLNDTHEVNYMCDAMYCMYGASGLPSANMTRNWYGSTPNYTLTFASTDYLSLSENRVCWLLDCHNCTTIGTTFLGDKLAAIQVCYGFVNKINSTASVVYSKYAEVVQQRIDLDTGRMDLVVLNQYSHVTDCVHSPYGFRDVDTRCYYYSTEPSANTLDSIEANTILPITNTSTIIFSNRQLFSVAGGVLFDKYQTTQRLYKYAVPEDVSIFSNSTGNYLKVPIPRQFNYMLKFGSQPTPFAKLTAPVEDLYPLRVPHTKFTTSIPSVSTATVGAGYQGCRPTGMTAMVDVTLMYGCAQWAAYQEGVSNNLLIIVLVPIAAAWILFWWILTFVHYCTLRKKLPCSRFLFCFSVPFLSPFTFISDLLLVFIIYPIFGTFIWLRSLCTRQKAYCPAKALREKINRRDVDGSHVHKFRIPSWWKFMWVVTLALLNRTSAQFYPGANSVTGSLRGETVEQTGNVLNSRYYVEQTIPTLNGYAVEYRLSDETGEFAGSLSVTVKDAGHTLNAEFDYYAFGVDSEMEYLNDNWGHCDPCNSDHSRTCFANAFITHGSIEECHEWPAGYVWATNFLPADWSYSQTGMTGVEYTVCVAKPVLGAFATVYHVAYLSTRIEVSMEQRDAKGMLVQKEDIRLSTYETSWASADGRLEVVLDVSNLNVFAISDRFAILQTTHGDNNGILADFEPFTTISTMYKAASYPTVATWPWNDEQIAFSFHSTAANAPIARAGALSCDWRRPAFSFQQLTAAFPSAVTATHCSVDTTCVREPDRKLGHRNREGIVCNDGDANENCIPMPIIRPTTPCNFTLTNCNGEAFTLRLTAYGFSEVDPAKITLTKDDITSATVVGEWASANTATLELKSKRDGILAFSQTGDLVPLNSVITILSGASTIMATSASRTPTALYLSDGTYITVSGELADPPEYTGDGDSGHEEGDDVTGGFDIGLDGWGFGQYLLTAGIIIIVILVLLALLFLCCRLPMPVPPLPQPRRSRTKDN